MHILGRIGVYSLYVISAAFYPILLYQFQRNTVLPFGFIYAVSDAILWCMCLVFVYTTNGNLTCIFITRLNPLLICTSVLYVIADKIMFICLLDMPPFMLVIISQLSLIISVLISRVCFHKKHGIAQLLSIMVVGVTSITTVLLQNESTLVVSEYDHVPIAIILLAVGRAFITPIAASIRQYTTRVHNDQIKTKQLSILLLQETTWLLLFHVITGLIFADIQPQIDTDMQVIPVPIITITSVTVIKVVSHMATLSLSNVIVKRLFKMIGIAMSYILVVFVFPTNDDPIINLFASILYIVCAGVYAYTKPNKTDRDVIRNSFRNRNKTQTNVADIQHETTTTLSVTTDQSVL
jgi:hypothetical protein